VRDVDTRFSVSTSHHRKHSTTAGGDQSRSAPAGTTRLRSVPVSPPASASERFPYSRAGARGLPAVQLPVCPTWLRQPAERQPTDG